MVEEMNLSLALALVSTSMLARRKGSAGGEPPPPPPVQTEIITQAEREEMERSPRAYRRRKLKELRRKGLLRE